MNTMPISRRIQSMSDTVGRTVRYLTESMWQPERRDPLVCDFLTGDPQEFPLEGITAAIQKWAVPQAKDWYAYKMSEHHPRQVVAASLRQSHGLPFEPDDITLTTGAFGALSAVLGTFIDPGDEIIYISPPWFFYEMLIVTYAGTPVRVDCDRATFDLDLEAIRAAITPRTRGIIINSPNNPTGRIYPPDTLKRLADLLAESSRANGRTIYLVSDESYRRILYDHNTFYSPVSDYPDSFLVYTYGKTLLAPGQRLGYIALPPGMQDRQAVRDGIVMSMVGNGYTFPNAVMQYALEDLEPLSIDMSHMQWKRDRMVKALVEMGYEMTPPEGTFYLLVKSPLEDDMAFTGLLRKQKIMCLPGSLFEMPGYFRISLTANDGMVERSLPGFEKTLLECRQNAGVKLPD